MFGHLPYSIKDRWTMIIDHHKPILDNRTLSACAGRHYKLTNPKSKKKLGQTRQDIQNGRFREWSAEEEVCIRAGIEKHGQERNTMTQTPQVWKTIIDENSEILGKRSMDAIRSRYRKIMCEQQEEKKRKAKAMSEGGPSTNPSSAASSGPFDPDDAAAPEPYYGEFGHGAPTNYTQPLYTETEFKCLWDAVTKFGEPSWSDLDRWQAILEANQSVLGGETAGNLRLIWSSIKVNEKKKVPPKYHWTVEQERCLQEGVERFGEGHWQKIVDTCEPLSKSKRATACMRHWNTEMKPRLSGPKKKKAKANNKGYSEEEKRVVQEGFIKCDGDWEKILKENSVVLKGRNAKSLFFNACKWGITSKYDEMQRKKEKEMRLNQDRKSVV